MLGGIIILLALRSIAPPAAVGRAVVDVQRRWARHLAAVRARFHVVVVVVVAVAVGAVFVFVVVFVAVVLVLLFVVVVVAAVAAAVVANVWGR